MEVTVDVRAVPETEELEALVSLAAIAFSFLGLESVISPFEPPPLFLS